MSSQAVGRPAQSDSAKDPISSSSSLHSIDKRGGTIDDTKSTDAKSVDSDDLQDSEPQPFILKDWLFRRRVYKPLDQDAVATRRSVYDDPDLAHHYWPNKDYENLHRFDIKARWTYREEKVNKLFHAPSTSP